MDGGDNIKEATWESVSMMLQLVSQLVLIFILPDSCLKLIKIIPTRSDAQAKISKKAFEAQVE